MKTKILFFLIMLAVFSASCARMGGIVEVLAPPSPEESLFESAEKSFRNASYREALKLYQQYLDRYPGSNLKPAAMMKIGMSHSELKAYAKARIVFSELVREHPGTDFARKAEIETLYTYFQEGRFREVIAYAGGISKEQLPPDLMERSRLILGDTYMALGAYPEAYLTFLEGFEKAGTGRQKPFEDRLMQTVAYLDPEFIEEALRGLNGRPPSGYLLYQLGVNSMAKGRAGDAQSAFTDFIEQYPRHPLADSARQRIEALQSETYFDGNRVGCLLPLSGQYEKIGNRALQAIQLALAEFGDRGIDPPVELIVRDTGGDSEKARLAVEEFAETGVSAIIGPIITAPAAAESAQKLGIPIITLTQKPGMVELGDFVFRNFMTPEMQMEALVDYAVGALGVTRIAVLYPDEAYGETYLNLFREKLRESNGSIVILEKYSPKLTDFSVLIKRLAAHRIPGGVKRSEVKQDAESGWSRPDQDLIQKSKPESGFSFDAIFIPDSPRKVGLIIPQLRFHDIDNVYLLGTNLWHSEALIKYARDYLHQAIIPDGFYAQSQDPHVRHFVEQFNVIFGRQPEFIEAVSYDTAMMVFDLIARPDINSRGALRDELLNMPPYEGVTGRTAFSETGDAEKALYLLGIENNQFMEIR